MRHDHEGQKKQSLVTFVLCVLTGLVGTLALGLCSSVQAQVVCAGTIDLSGGTVKLTSDLNCVSTDNPGLTVNGPGTLDLDGHAVSGPGTGTGILVQGERAEIVNGAVKGWATAVDVKTGNNHRIANLTIENNSAGIRVRTDKNSVINNCIKDNSDRGIRVGGVSNTLMNNYIENSNKGIRIDDGSDNNIVFLNTMVGNNSENCDIKGNYNLLVNNLAKNAAEECFSIGDVEESTIAATGNRLVNNTALQCQKGGFVAAATTFDNYILNNTALGNSPDLRDLNEKCEANTWIMNIAYSANPECTKARIWDDNRPVGGTPGWTSFDVNADERLVLDLNITNNHGDAVSEIKAEWLVLTGTMGGAQLPMFVITSGRQIFDIRTLSDFNAVTYSFNHNSDVATLVTLTMRSLGLKAGDTFIYGYAYTTSDLSGVVLDNVVTLNVN